MKSLLRSIIGALAFVGAAAHAQSTGDRALNCHGEFPNPITDICWSCILPITVGNAEVANYGSQEDTDNPADVACTCVVNPTGGISIGFWEPARHVEVVRKPYCFPTLGGLVMDPGIKAPSGAQHTRDGGDKKGHSFYQSHYYKNPVMTWMELVTDWPCLEQGSFDLGYLTEVDPLWNDDSLNLIINPEALLFANPIAHVACAVDCVAASVDFGLRDMFWCAGCQGGMYPLNGLVAQPMGGVDMGSLLAQRMVFKMHRELLAWAWHGRRGLCGPYYEPTMDKTAYKLQLISPRPVTALNGVSCLAGDSFAGGQCQGSGSSYDPTVIVGEGRCCAPLGRTTIFSGAGREYPVRGEDFAYMLFRKRNCCVGY